MFARKKASPPEKKKRNRDLSQFGLIGAEDDFGMDGSIDDTGGDSDLEAELAALATGGGPKPKPKPKKLVVAPSELDRMVADSMRDIPDEDISDPENDPDVLNELAELTGGDEAAALPEPLVPQNVETKPAIIMPTTTLSQMELIQQRILMYQEAEAQAKEKGESSRAKRFGRGLNTLRDLLKQANAGKSINPDDIPPEVLVKKQEPTPAGEPSITEPARPTREAPMVPSSPPPVMEPLSSPSAVESPTSDEPTKPANPKTQILLARQKEYKSAALASKKSGDIESAKSYMKIAKMFDVVIKASEDGQDIDLNEMPPPPSELDLSTLPKEEQVQSAPSPHEPAKEESQVQHSSESTLPVGSDGLITASSVKEALEQRLDKFKQQADAAEKEGNTSKSRRYGRIVKQYEDAIKMHQKGKPIPIDELPTPPGYGPIPVDGGTAPKPVAPAPRPAPAIPQQPSSNQLDENIPKPTSTGTKPKEADTNEHVFRVGGNHKSTSLAEKQLAILLNRQKEYKLAAIEAKKAGDMEQAKEYLRIFKGLENLVNVASGGLPVDMDTIPLPPTKKAELEDTFTFVTDDETNDDGSGDLAERMELQLKKQLMMCKNTRDHNRAIGDIAGSNRFENLAVSVQKDLDILFLTKKKNLPLPRFHYEKKNFNIVKCNTDLTDNEIEIGVIRGITYNVSDPNDVDTFVKVEFPWPQEEGFKTKTNVAKDSDNPDYDERFKTEISRNARQCQRVFKRHGVKLEVYRKGGWFRSDILLGTVNVKLQQLETVCEIHDTFDIMDGRKNTGGKLEVRIRVRNPILTKQIEHIEEKWLVID